MTALIFLGTIIAILVLIVQLINKLFQKRNLISTIRILIIIISGYALLWILFYLLSSNKTVPAGTDICFDDWCATVMTFEKSDTLGKENHLSRATGLYAILHIKMSNHARGIAQMPLLKRAHLSPGYF